MCKGETNTLTAQGASTYSWSTSSTSSVAVITPSANITYNYLVTGSNSAGCTHTAQVSVKVNACTGINEVESTEHHIKIFPNPSNGLFTIYSEANQVGKTIRILSVYGAVILEKSIGDIETPIDIQDQAKGIYFVYVLDGEKTTFLSKIILE
jgi:Secretion system C-terminal sorting domain